MLFSNKDTIFQEDNLPTHKHTARSVWSWFQEYEDALHLPLPALLPDFSNHCGQFLESSVRSRFPSPLSLKQLEDVLHEDWYNILLGTI
jgi:hypothetical protein